MAASMFCIGSWAAHNSLFGCSETKPASSSLCRRQYWMACSASRFVKYVRGLGDSIWTSMPCSSIAASRRSTSMKGLFR